MAVEDVANLDAALSLPWVQDDISELAYKALDKLGFLDTPNPANLYAALNVPWVYDGISETEYDIIDSLGALDFDAPDVVSQLFLMPFLLSPDATDALAIRGMENLADRGRLATLTDHSTFEDGVTDDETTLIAGVGTLRDTDEIRRVLNPGGAAIETISLGTELTPHLKISIIRTDSQSRPGTVGSVRDAVEFVEKTVGLPLPVNHVIIMLNDLAVAEKYAGTNFGFAYSYKPKYEAAQGTFEWRHLQTGFVHETAHYFWTGNENWIDEGLANIVEYQFGLQMGLSHGQLQTERKNCEAHDLEMLSEWDPDRADVDRYHCVYYLGQPLFYDLLESMGAETFTSSLRDYYRLSLEVREEDRTPSIAEVRKAFAGQDAIIDRHWSGKMNAPENRPFDEGYERTSHDLIRWEQYPTFADGVVEFKGVLLGDGILVSRDATEISRFEFAAFKLRSADGGADLGSILPPPRPGRKWILDDPGDVQAATFAINEAERRFHIRFEWPTALGGVPEDVVVHVLGYQNSDRDPTIGSKVDALGYARIRVPPTSTLKQTPTAVPVYAAAWNRLDNAAWLEANHPSLAVEIKDLPWVQNGINDAEFKALREFLYLALWSRTAVSNMLEYGWVKDGVDAREADTIDWVVGFNDAANSLSITKLAWVQDGIDEVELQAIRRLTEIATTDPDEATRVMVLPWVQDGIDIRDVGALWEADPYQLPTTMPPPAVRVIYATPSDAEANPIYMEAVQEALHRIQDWYADKLNGVTYELRDPVPEHCTLAQPADYYAREGGWDRTITDLQHCAPVKYPSLYYVWVIYVDTPFDCEASELGRGGGGVTLMHRDDLDGLANPEGNTQCGFHRPQRGYIGGAAHELGHAFGLPHPPGCDDGLDTCDEDLLMSGGYAYDFPDTHLTKSDISILRASPFVQYRPTE